MNAVNLKLVKDVQKETPKLELIKEPIAKGLRKIASKEKILSPRIKETIRKNKSWDNFEFQPSVTVNITEDVRAAFRAMKPSIALYVGGMGHKNMNFHKQQMIARGYGETAERIQELYLAGRKAEALEEIPDEYCDESSLIGSKARIKERYMTWADSGITGLTVNTREEEALEFMAEIAEVAPLRV